MFKKSLLASSVGATAVSSYLEHKPEPENKTEIRLYTTLTLVTLENCKTYGGVAWHLWYRHADFDKDYVTCEYAKQLIRTELKKHKLDHQMTSKNRMITSLLRIVELPHTNFWKAVNAILNDPSTKELLP